MDTLAHLFTPRESNNQKARILHPSFLTIFLLIVIIFQYAIQFTSTKPLQILGYASDISVEQVIKLTNEEREKNGLQDVTQNPLLTQAAQEKAQDMITKGYWAHIAPDGTQPWQFFSQVNYKYRYAGENLARDFKDPQSAVAAWMASPSHRDNLLSPKYRDIGIAVIDGQINGRDTTIIVQLFGTLLADADKLPLVTPTSPPTLDLAQANHNTLSVADVDGLSLPTISPFDLTKIGALAVVAVFIAVFIIDLLVMSRKKISRLSGKSFAHLSFFVMILIVILLVKAGNIL